MQVLVGLQNGIDVQQALAPGAAAVAAGSALTVSNDLGPVSALFNVGVIGAGDSLTFQLEETTDGGTTWQVIPGTSAVTWAHADHPNGGVVSITGKNTYSQVRVNVTAVTGTIDLSAVLLSQQRVGSTNPGGYSNYPATAS